MRGGRGRVREREGEGGRGRGREREGEGGGGRGRDSSLQYVWYNIIVQ